MGVIARHEGDVFALGQPDPAEAQHSGIHHVNQVGLERINGFRHRRPRQGQFEFGVEGQWHGGYADQPCSHVLVRAAFGAEHHHVIPSLHQMAHRLGQTGDDAIHLRQEGFSEEGDFHGVSRIRRRRRWPAPGFWSRRRCRGCGCGRSGRRSGWRFPRPLSTVRRRGWWG